MSNSRCFKLKPQDARIRRRIESRRVPEKDRIWASTGDGQNPGEYQRRIESGRVLEKGIIRASTVEG